MEFGITYYGTYKKLGCESNKSSRDEKLALIRRRSVGYEGKK